MLEELFRDPRLTFGGSGHRAVPGASFEADEIRRASSLEYGRLTICGAARAKPFARDRQFLGTIYAVTIACDEANPWEPQRLPGQRWVYADGSFHGYVDETFTEHVAREGGRTVKALEDPTARRQHSPKEQYAEQETEDFFASWGEGARRDFFND